MMRGLFCCFCCMVAKNQNTNRDELLDQVGEGDQVVIPLLSDDEVRVAKEEFSSGGSAFARLVKLTYQGEEVSAVEKCIQKSKHAGLLSDELAILTAIKRIGGHVNIIYCYGYTHAVRSVHHGSLVLEHANRADLQNVFTNKSLHLSLQAKMLNMGGQIAQGLDFLHSMGIIHRDLKLENILLHVRGSWVVKIADFGSAKMIPDGKETICVEYGFATTPEYVAPEMFQNPYGVEVDIYAFAVVLWRMASMNQAWPYPDVSEDFLSRASEHPFYEVACQGRRPDLSCINHSSPLFRHKDLMARMWHADPTHRPTAVEVGKSLLPETSVSIGTHTAS